MSDYGPEATSRVQRAYGARAAEYSELLGDLDQMESDDVTLIKTWGELVTGPILDVGCGPGHWTELLSTCNPRVIGIDVVPEFITLASQRFPEVQFETMKFEDATFPDGLFSGLLAWYSLIHLDKIALRSAFDQCNRLLQTEGTLLLGFFAGPSWQSFPHAITEAFFWPIDKIRLMLTAAGFRTDEVHARSNDRHRDHGAIVAIKL